MKVAEKQITSNFLIVDDHPMTVDGYIALLSSIKSKTNQECFTAFSCKEGYELIAKLAITKDAVDLAFFDVNLPPYEEKKIMSGIDLAILMRSMFPKCKIVIISMHNEPVWVNKIFKSLNPEGFISKNDVNYKTFPLICEQILKGKPFVSESISESQKNYIQQSIFWDVHDSEILILLSRGIKTINLPLHIPLSLSSIEKRKAALKKQLVYEHGSDKDLIEIAKKLGFI